VVSFTPLPLYTQPRTHWIGSWVCPRDGPDDVEKRKILYPTGTRTPTPQSSSPYPVAIPTELSRLLHWTKSYFLWSQLSRWLPSFHVRKEADTVSETLSSLEYRTMHNSKSPIMLTVIQSVKKYMLQRSVVDRFNLITFFNTPISGNASFWH
jgi:hypothetical protein